ncbi:NADH dehydrogenase [ubiquinone] 1 alpha subcomplex subunit 5 [Nematostella vectensis]|uniref:NADH dehydrogenase [ubiquinone] 1 alpha subcomplex subunit 5 n=1 Tax=Nematostella vectensis TaxID=45351 RepID=UPI002077349D|nr:NADH dehydrogenase [ubiquinone] 1 alpha subcomplex subunit 5 [Nematostella vectensis]
MAAYLKRSTGLVGLAVAKAPREALIGLYQKTLGVLDKMPRDAAYRVHTEQITKHRLSIVEQETDIEALEKKLKAGQVEEVIRQAENELSLAEKMRVWKPWEPLQTPPPVGQWKWPI